MFRFQSRFDGFTATVTIKQTYRFTGFGSDTVKQVPS